MWISKPRAFLRSSSVFLTNAEGVALNLNSAIDCQSLLDDLIGLAVAKESIENLLIKYAGSAGKGNDWFFRSLYLIIQHIEECMGHIQTLLANHLVGGSKKC